MQKKPNAVYCVMRNKIYRVTERQTQIDRHTQWQHYHKFDR